MRTLGRAFRHPNFRLFYGGQVVSLSGLWMQYTAMAWLVFRLTDSAAMVGVTTLAMQGPGLVLGPIAGALADRHDKRRILVAMQAFALLTSLVLGLLTVLEIVQPWHVVLVAFAAGMARAVEVPTRHAFLPELVDRGDLSNAIALNSALFNIARLAGPAMAGVLIPTVGEGWCFLGNSMAGLGIIAALLLMRLQTRRRRPETEIPTLWTDIGEGLAYVRAEPSMRAALGALTVVAAFGMPYGVLMPSFAERALGGGPETYSQLQVAIALGALVGALRLAARLEVEGLDRWSMFAGIGFGSGLMMLSFARSTAAAFPILVFVGLAFIVQLASVNTLLQTLVPDRLRGRVMSLNSSLLLGIFPIFGLVAGWLADRVGEALVIRGGGGLVVVGAVILGRRLSARASASLERARELRLEEELAELAEDPT